MTVSHKTTQIYYTVEGEDNPLVLLHGFLESCNIWNSLIKKLKPKRQVIAIDLPGHGKSGCFGEVHTMEEMAEAVYKVLLQLKVAKADFLGHSMGGYVVLALLEKYPGMVGNLFLLNSTPAADSPERKENRERAVEIVRKNKDAFVSMAISNLLTPENNEKFRKPIQLLKKEAKTFSTEGIIAAIQGMKNRTNRTELLANFTGRKFILAGEQDPILSFLEMKNLSETCKCDFISFSGGHLSYLENRNEFEEFVYFID